MAKGSPALTVAGKDYICKGWVRKGDGIQGTYSEVWIGLWEWERPLVGWRYDSGARYGRRHNLS
jgi:hypothetical protein